MRRRGLLADCPLLRRGQRGREDPVPPGDPPSSEKSLDNPPEICYNARR